MEIDVKKIILESCLKAFDEGFHSFIQFFVENSDEETLLFELLTLVIQEEVYINVLD